MYVAITGTFIGIEENYCFLNWSLQS